MKPIVNWGDHTQSCWIDYLWVPPYPSDYIPYIPSTLPPATWTTSTSTIGETTSYTVSLNAYRKEDSYIVLVYVPGFSRDNIEIIVEGEKLIVTGEMENIIEGLDVVIEGSEHTFIFEEEVDLPNLDSEKIAAKLTDGLLVIEVPIKTRRVVIQSEA